MTNTNQLILGRVTLSIAICHCLTTQLCDISPSDLTGGSVVSRTTIPAGQSRGPAVQALSATLLHRPWGWLWAAFPSLELHFFTHKMRFDLPALGVGFLFVCLPQTHPSQTLSVWVPGKCCLCPIT